MQNTAAKLSADASAARASAKLLSEVYGHHLILTATLPTGSLGNLQQRLPLKWSAWFYWASDMKDLEQEQEISRGMYDTALQQWALDLTAIAAHKTRSNRRSRVVQRSIRMSSKTEYFKPDLRMSLIQVTDSWMSMPFFHLTATAPSVLRSKNLPQKASWGLCLSCRAVSSWSSWDVQCGSQGKFRKRRAELSFSGKSILLASGSEGHDCLCIWREESGSRPWSRAHQCCEICSWYKRCYKGEPLFPRTRYQYPLLLPDFEAVSYTFMARQSQQDMERNSLSTASSASCIVAWMCSVYQRIDIYHISRPYINLTWHPSYRHTADTRLRPLQPKVMFSIWLCYWQHRGSALP